MKQEVTVPADKPLLNERMFQQLLSAAYTLQLQLRHFDLKESARLSCAESVLAGRIPQELSKRDFKPPLFASQPLTQRQEPAKPWDDRITAPNGFLLAKETSLPLVLRKTQIWRTVEAFAIGTVFCCFMVNAMVHGLSSHGGVFSPDTVAEQPSGLHKPEQRINAANPSRLAGNEAEGLKPAQRAKSTVIARDSVVRYLNLPSSQPFPARLLGNGSQANGTTRSRFPQDTDMIAADTVLRYGKDLGAPQKPVIGKVSPIIPDSLRSTAR